MHLFNASSLFTEAGMEEFLRISSDANKLQQKIIEIKQTLLKTYRFKTYNIPPDYADGSYIIAANHLTDSDAPLIMSFHYEQMRIHGKEDTKLFVFAKENCFNGVSIPKELGPILDMEKVVPVDRTKTGGSMMAIKEAKRWYAEGSSPKDFLIFPQGTIYDINLDVAEDIERGAFWLAKLLGIPVLPAFIEQAVEGEENRLVFGEPIHISETCRDFEDVKQLWLDKVIEAQDKLLEYTGIPAREVILDEEHKIRKRFEKKQ